MNTLYSVNNGNRTIIPSTSTQTKAGTSSGPFLFKSVKVISNSSFAEVTYSYTKLSFSSLEDEHPPAISVLSLVKSLADEHVLPVPVVSLNIRTSTKVVVIMSRRVVILHVQVLPVKVFVSDLKTMLFFSPGGYMTVSSQNSMTESL